jgi:hypothetical protein
MARLAALLLSLATLLPFSAAADTYLLMAEEDGCFWCKRWNTEIGHIYPKTKEGKTAPLKRYDVHRDKPKAKLAQRVSFVPTFILVHNGAEVGRIEGYPGEDFFWGVLNEMFTNARIPLDRNG